MKPKFGESLKVVYKDTDSLLYRIETDDLYSDMESSKHLLDLSDYPQNHKLFDSIDKKLLLTMKDELNGQIMLEATCLRSKLYSINYESGIKQSAKGVQKCSKKPFTTISSMMFCPQEESFVSTWPKFNLNSINCSRPKSTKLSWVFLTTNVSSWRMESSSSPMVTIRSSEKLLIVLFFLVPMNFHLNIVDIYLLILFRWPTYTQWADKKNHGNSCAWWWMWNSLHNFIINIPESWVARKCLCSLLLITFCYWKLLYASKHFSLCINLSVLSKLFSPLFSSTIDPGFTPRSDMKRRKSWWWWRRLGGHCRFRQSHWLWWRWRPGLEEMSFYTWRILRSWKWWWWGGRRTIKTSELIRFIVTIYSKSFNQFYNGNSQNAPACAHQSSSLESFLQ